MALQLRPEVMWGVDDDIRDLIGDASKIAGEEHPDKDQLAEQLKRRVMKCLR